VLVNADGSHGRHATQDACAAATRHPSIRPSRRSDARTPPPRYRHAQPTPPLTPTLALKDGRPFLSFAVQGGDSQDQNLLQFFLNVVEFGMTVQQAVEAPNLNSYQMRSSFGGHESRPGRMLVATSLPEATRAELRRMGYTLELEERTSGPINAILFDRAHGTMWGGSSNHGEDYGIAW
jgi:gamma-glutamyltranspeptidase/glutathione hydrolase